MSAKVHVLRPGSSEDLQNAGNGLSRPRVGIVASVDRDAGEIVLVHRGGTRSRLTATPKLLNDVRPWAVVLVVTEGSHVRVLRSL